jgi:hypothetical protein
MGNIFHDTENHSTQKITSFFTGDFYLMPPSKSIILDTVQNLTWGHFIR